MPEFDVFSKVLRDDAGKMEKIVNDITRLEDKASTIASNLSISSKSASQYRARIKAIAENMNLKANNVGSMSEGLTEVAEAYEKHEKKIMGACKDGKIIYSEKQNQHPHKTETKIGEGGEYKADKKFKEKKGTWRKGYYDKEGWHDEKDKESPKKKFGDHISDIKLASIGSTYEVMAWGIQDESEHTSYTVKALDFEAHANAFAGVMGLDENGHKVFRPGAGFDVGASATGFTAEGQAKIGDDMLGGYVGGDVTVGKAEAKATGKIGYVDGHINASIDASAELIGAEANANVGAKIAGVDVKGEVGVNVGLGAHFNVGVEGGKVKFDIGASLGIGVSASVEVDFSGVFKDAEKVVKSVKKIGKAISKLFDWF